MLLWLCKFSCTLLGCWLLLWLLVFLPLPPAIELLPGEPDHKLFLLEGVGGLAGGFPNQRFSLFPGLPIPNDLFGPKLLRPLKAPLLLLKPLPTPSLSSLPNTLIFLPSSASAGWFRTSVA